MFITNGMYLLFTFFMFCPESPLCKSDVGLLPVKSRSSLKFFLLDTVISLKDSDEKVIPL